MEDETEGSEESEADEQEADVSLVPKPRTKSAVWNYFRVESDSDGQPSNLSKLVCTKCLTAVSAMHGNTSNLFTHLRRKHPLLFAQVCNKRSRKKSGTTKRTAEPSGSEDQPTIVHAFSQNQKYERKSKKWQKLTNVVSRCIAKDMLPMAIVEKPGFKNMSETFDPRYQLPSRKYISQEAIPSLYNSTQASVTSMLQSASHFCSTTDLRSSVNMQPYLSYTVHFISEDWRLQSKCLQTLFMPADHNGENLAESMKSVLDGWGLSEEKQICITTDDGSNLVRACCLLNWLHIPCFGHNLHLAITNAIKDDHRVARALGVIRKLLTHFPIVGIKKRSNKGTNRPGYPK